MINKIIYWILHIFLLIVKIIVSVIILPLTVLFNTIFPGLSTYTTYVTNFLNDYVFNGIKFFKQVFLNITHFPSALFSLAVLFIIGLFTYYTSTAAIRMLKGFWYTWKGRA